MLKIISQQENANQSHMRYYFTLTKMTTFSFSFLFLKQIIASVAGDGEKLEPAYTAGRNVKWHSHFKESSVCSLNG